MNPPLLHLLLAALALPALLMCAYLLLLTLLSSQLRRALPTVPAAQLRHFVLVVPAHNEAAGIAGAVRSLQALDWPRSAARILVVADNCDDDTAAQARAAGADVLERRDASLRGKGHALAFAFDHALRERWADALVVVDADTEVHPGLLRAFARRLDQGALAVQALYEVRNPGAAWRTRLMAIALGAFHTLRSRARERMGLSCGIRGNGWCITPAALVRVPYQAFSLTEDAEFGIALGLAGIRVAYSEEAPVAADMVAGEAASRSQRQRWEHGRGALIRACAPALLRQCRQGSHRRIAADLLCDLLVWPLSSIALNVAALGLLGGLASLWRVAFLPWLALAGILTAILVGYVLRGWQLSGIGKQGLLDLARAPFYIAWKLWLMVRRHDARRWVRTTREKS